MKRRITCHDLGQIGIASHMERRNRPRRPSWIVLTIILAALIVGLIAITGCAPTCDRSISTQNCCQQRGDGKTECHV